MAGRCDRVGLVMATPAAMNTVQMLAQTLAAPASLTQFTQASSSTCTFIFLYVLGML